MDLWFVNVNFGNKTAFLGNTLANVDHISMNMRDTRSMKAMYNELTQHWIKHKQGRTTFKILPTWTPQKFNRNNSRKHEGYYIRLSFQQNETKASQHKRNNNTEPTCTRCNSHPETAQHILHDCTALTTQRNKMLNRINQNYPNIKPTTQKLLTSKPLQPFVLSFLKCCT